MNTNTLELYQEDRRHFIGVRKEGEFVTLRYCEDNDTLSFTSGIPYSYRIRDEAVAIAEELEYRYGDLIAKLAKNLVKAPVIN